MLAEQGSGVGEKDDLLHGAATQFSPLLAKSSLATAEEDAPRSSETYLDQQRVDLTKFTTLSKSSQILGI